MWTNTLPTTTGYFWCRHTGHPDDPFVAHVNRTADDMGGPFVSGPGHAGSVGAEEYAHCEWWPEMIRRP